MDDPQVERLDHLGIVSQIDDRIEPDADEEITNPQRPSAAWQE